MYHKHLLIKKTAAIAGKTRVFGLRKYGGRFFAAVCFMLSAAALFAVALSSVALSSVALFAADAEFMAKQIDTARFEACGVADFNKDGKPDVVAGEFLYLAPDWKKIQIRKIKSDVKQNGKGYAWDFANLTMDVDGDGWIDIVACDWFSKQSMWFKNPGNFTSAAGLWKETLIEKKSNFETMEFFDVNGDGKKDIVPANEHTCWYEHHKNGTFTIRTVSEKKHLWGNGTGDLNGDGRPDMLRGNAWFEAPQDIDKGEWKEHPLILLSDDQRKKIKDCAQIYVRDINKDGKPDIIASAAHDYGIYWFETPQEPSAVAAGKWTRHVIDESWSQVHAVLLADIDGDGQEEVIAGKRFYAHNGSDNGADDPLCTVYYKPVLKDGKVSWNKHIISDQFGAGMSLHAADMDGDGDLDIITTGKFGGPVIYENRINLIKKCPRHFIGACCQ